MQVLFFMSKHCHSSHFADPLGPRYMQLESAYNHKDLFFPPLFRYLNELHSKRNQAQPLPNTYSCNSYYLTIVLSERSLELKGLN